MLRNRRILVIVPIILIALAIAAVVRFNLNKGIENDNLLLNKGNKNEIAKGLQIAEDQDNSPTTPVPPQQNTNENTNRDSGGRKKPVKVGVKAKAIYITGSSAGNRNYLNKVINMINSTELNAVVIDVKEDGRVNYKSEVDKVKGINAYHELYNVDEVLKTLHDNNIYVIGRVVCFRDNYLALKRADLAVKNSNGAMWKENGSIAWTNPYNKEVWQYNIEIAKEAVRKGFDEIQFDYVRFPTARKTDVYYGDVPPKADAISGFLKQAGNELNAMGVLVSADIFAIVCESPGDREGIGQVLEKVGTNIDYISPMIYPSHYANNSKGMMGNGVGQSINGVLFKAPDLKPYDVVYNALTKTRNRVSKTDGYRAKVRPYLQYFTATYLPKGYYQSYGPEQVKQQIKAVYDAGYEEWIFWDASNAYKDRSFVKG